MICVHWTGFYWCVCAHSGAKNIHTILITFHFISLLHFACVDRFTLCICFIVVFIDLLTLSQTTTLDCEWFLVCVLCVSDFPSIGIFSSINVCIGSKLCTSLHFQLDKFTLEPCFQSYFLLFSICHWRNKLPVHVPFSRYCDGCRCRAYNHVNRVSCLFFPCFVPLCHCVSFFFFPFAIIYVLHFFCRQSNNNNNTKNDFSGL